MGKRFQHMCDQCDFVTTYKASLEEHIITVHEKRKDLKCTYPNCKYASGLIRKLRSHIRKVHEKRYVGKTKTGNVIKNESTLKQEELPSLETEDLIFEAEQIIAEASNNSSNNPNIAKFVTAI